MSNYGITYGITRKGMLELFWDSICGGSIGFGNVSLDCDKRAYDEARERTAILKAANPSEYITGASVCYEDVMAEVLRAGGELYYMEYGYDDENSTAVAFDLDHLMDNFENVEPWIMDKMLSQNYDSIVTDSLLQCLLLGEIVYG